jgi:hypothetical protein
MPRQAAVAALVVAGCGRVSFETLPAHDAAGSDAFVCVAPVGHDEDGDGIDDACDPCPHIAGDAADADGDGVGDACDPDPAPVEHFTLFDPFLVSRPAVWAYNAQTALGTDVLNITGVNTYSAIAFVEPATPAKEIVSFDLDVTAGGPGNQRQFDYEIANAADIESYFCEINDQGGSTSLILTWTMDRLTYTNVMITPTTGPVMTGRARITMQNEFPHIICTAEWKGQTLTAEGDVPATLTGTFHYFAANNVNVSLRSAVRISTGP